VIAVVPPVLFAIAQFQSWQAAVLVLAGMGAIQFTIGNYIDPRLEGRALAISPLVVVVSIFGWALVWGGARRLHRGADDDRADHLLRAVRADALDRAPARLAAPPASNRAAG
jgi:hypothetical protein